MAFTLRLDDDVHRRLKIEAAMRGVLMNEMVTRALLEYLDRQPADDGRTVRMIRPTAP